VMISIPNETKPMLEVAPDGIIMRVNPAFEALSGYRGELTNAKPLNSILRMATGCLENGCEVSITKPNGKEVKSLAIVSTLFDNSMRPYRYQVSLLELSRIPAIKERIDALDIDKKSFEKEMRTFVSHVSHDLRTPLVSIKGFSMELKALLAELAEHVAECRVQTSSCKETFEERYEAAMEAVNYIESSSARVERLVNSLVGLYKASTAQLNDTVVNTHKMIGNILSSMQHQIDRKNCQVSLRPTPELRIDLSVAERIFGNILDNAVKYLDPSRPGELVIDYWLSEPEIIFSIKDNGIGIDYNSSEHVFRLFGRANDCDETPGDGVGMAMVKALLKLYNGRIWYTSIPDKGTTFFVALPLSMVVMDTKGSHL